MNGIELAPVCRESTKLSLVYDREALLSDIGGDLAILAELEQSFLEEWPHLQAEISAASQAGAMRQLADLAHKLKGSFGVFHAQRASAAARELEKRAKTGSAGDAAKAAHALIQEANQMIERFEA
ncbi:MAG: Hpt domain-containing protein [Planctomycetes bacterium]|nr:Hpt domain-containing protein [Planctomycetota bacterium]